MPQGLAPTLLVGLGTSGLRILSELEKLVYATFGKNRLPFFRCLYLETDISENPEKTPADSEITPIKLRAPHGLQETYQKLCKREDLDLDWLPPKIPDQVPSTEKGAGGVRPAGRMLLWGENNFSDFYQAIQNAKQNIDQAVRQPDPELREIIGRSQAELDENARAFVVGSLVGGTGSGIFIDVGYVIQKITNNKHDLYGIFLLPKEDDQLTFGFGNCYGALKEYEYFSNRHIEYPVKFPNQVTLYKTDGLGPYTICYLTSTAYGQTQFGSMQLSSLYKVVALRLFCELLGLSQMRGSVLTDQARANYGDYGGFGISAVMYPKYSVTEAVACRLGQQLCNLLLDRNVFLNKVGGETQIVSGDLLNDARAFLDSCLEGVFQALGARGGEAVSLDTLIESDANRILKKEVTAAELLRDQFSKPSSGNYYSTVFENLAAACQVLAERVTEHVSTLLEARQNLTCAELLVKSLQQRINETLDYWEKALNVPLTTSEWPNWINLQIEQLLARRNRLYLIHRDTLIDRMRELLKLLKMFSLREPLEKLKNGLEEGTVSFIGGSYAIPSTVGLKNFSGGLEIIRNQLESRYNDIRTESADKSVPVMRVWRYGDFEKDVDALLRDFNALQAQQKIHLKNVSDLPAWKLLSNTIRVEGERVNAEALLEVIKPNYQKKLYEVISRQQFNPSEAATREIGTTIKYVRMAMAGFLPLNGYDRPHAQGIPRFVLGRDAGELTELVQSLRNAGCDEFPPQSVRSLPLLDHAVVFYDEQPNVRPLELLAMRTRLKEHFENPDASFKFNRDVWKAHRMAYAIEAEQQARRVRREEVRERMRFLLDFGVRYERDFHGLKAKSPQWDWLRLRLGQPVRFQFSDKQGIERILDLEPDDTNRMRLIADDEQAFSALDQAVRKAIMDVSLEGLVKIFNQQIQERLIGEKRSGPEIDSVRQFYFLEQAESDRGESENKGFVIRILEQGKFMQQAIRS
jgi:hypothetical protein